LTLFSWNYNIIYPTIFIVFIGYIFKEAIMKKFPVFSVFILVGCAALMFFSCNKEKPAPAQGTAKPRQILVGTGNAFKDYCFIDEKGELVGYEIDILKAVDEILPQYEFTLDTAEFRAILVGLEAKKYDFAAHNYAKNAEREAKFLYGKTPISVYSYSLVVKKGRSDIKSLKDLEGKNVTASSGSNVSALLEEYNRTEATIPINLIYGALDDEAQVKGITENRFDAYILPESRFLDQEKEYPDKIQETGPHLLPGYTYYIFATGEEQLQKDVDEALAKLRANGTLKRYSEKWFFKNYTDLLPELESLRAQGKA
jgi:L-cystine transport system substrate-binding protein